MMSETLSASSFVVCRSWLAAREPRITNDERRIVRGFSLVELVISMAILSVGIVGAMRVFPVGLRTSRRAELSSRATILAQRTLECLKLKPWEELVEGEQSQPCQLSEVQAAADDDTFTVTARISQSQPEHLVDPSRLKRVEVAVRWTQDGRPRGLTFVTYLRHDTS